MSSSWACHYSSLQADVSKNIKFQHYLSTANTCSCLGTKMDAWDWTSRLGRQSLISSNFFADVRAPRPYITTVWAVQHCIVLEFLDSEAQGISDSSKTLLTLVLIVKGAMLIHGVKQFCLPKQAPRPTRLCEYSVIYLFLHGQIVHVHVLRSFPITKRFVTYPSLPWVNIWN